MGGGVSLCGSLLGVLSPPSTQLKEACPEPHFSLELQRSWKPILSPFCDPWGLLCSVQLRGAPVRVLSAPPPMRHPPIPPVRLSGQGLGAGSLLSAPLTLPPTLHPHPPFPILCSPSPSPTLLGCAVEVAVGCSFSAFLSVLSQLLWQEGSREQGLWGRWHPRKEVGELRSCHRAPLTAIEALCSALDVCFSQQSRRHSQSPGGTGDICPSETPPPPPLPPKALWPCMLLGSTWRLHSL